jgi:cyclase
VPKRIIPCLDIKEGRVVKGVQFANLKDAGDPVELAVFYDRAGADELVLLDVAATPAGRETMIRMLGKVAEKVSIPLTVGGGVGTAEDMRTFLEAGADKVSLATAAVKDPALVVEGARLFGSTSIVVAVDACWVEDKCDWEVYIQGGKKATGLPALDWIPHIERLGAGEILLTSMNADGGRGGFDIPLYEAVTERVNIPVIASGGAGTMEHFARVFMEGRVDAALAASVFHYRHLEISELKKYLQQQGVEVRMG